MAELSSLLQCLMQQQADHDVRTEFPGLKSPKMHPYNEGEDIEHYLITFERIAHACQWLQDEWALHQAPLLTSKAKTSA